MVLSQKKQSAELFNIFFPKIEQLAKKKNQPNQYYCLIQQIPQNVLNFFFNLQQHQKKYQNQIFK